MPNSERPISITVISWFLIVTCLLGMIMAPIVLYKMQSLLYADASMGVATSQSRAIISELLSLVCAVAIFISAIFMLKGRNWSRIVYILFSAISVIAAFVYTVQFKFLIHVGPIFEYAVIAFLLYRKNATKFFQTKH